MIYEETSKYEQTVKDLADEYWGMKLVPSAFKVIFSVKRDDEPEYYDKVLAFVDEYGEESLLEIAEQCLMTLIGDSIIDRNEPFIAIDREDGDIYLEEDAWVC